MRNNGPAIPEKQRARIFEPGFTTKRTGQGMGLFIVNQTVTELGGRITVDSRDGDTVFSGFVPRKRLKLGEGADEKGIDKKTGKVIVEVSPDFYRPTDVVNLWGDPTKAKAELGWNPAKTSFEELVKIMVDADMAKVAGDNASEKVRTNLVEYLEKGIVK